MTVFVWAARTMMGLRAVVVGAVMVVVSLAAETGASYAVTSSASATDTGLFDAVALGFVAASTGRQLPNATLVRFLSDLGCFLASTVISFDAGFPARSAACLRGCAQAAALRAGCCSHEGEEDDWRA